MSNAESLTLKYNECSKSEKFLVGEYFNSINGENLDSLTGILDSCLK